MKLFKTAIFEDLDSPILISRKIWVTEKFYICTLCCGNFVKVPFFYWRVDLMKYFLGESNFSFFQTVPCTVWKVRNITASILPQKFREITFSQKNFALTKLIWRKNNLHRAVNFSFFYTVSWNRTKCGNFCN